MTDPIVKQELQEQLKDDFTINDNDEVSPSILWEWAKAVLRGKIIALSAKLKKQLIEKQHGVKDGLNRL